MTHSDEGRFGIWFPNSDTVMSDSHMNSVADAVRAAHGYGLEQAAQFGVLVEQMDGQWVAMADDWERWKRLWFGEHVLEQPGSNRKPDVGTLESEISTMEADEELRGVFE